MKFTAALNSWLSQHSSVSQRQLAMQAGVPGPDLSKFRNGKRPVTFDALSKLLPAIEALSSRTHARTLLIAYLHDETPPAYEPDVSIQPIGEAGRIDLDPIASAAARWQSKGRTDAEFARMWLTLDGYMHDPEASSRSSSTDPAEIALLAEPAPIYGGTGGSDLGGCPPDGPQLHGRHTQRVAAAPQKPIID